ncbi:single-stranded-DNA-specific exonuclease RecJ [bacterium]|nr:single-stranded-DNA-specific exonuclease RecJ [bacterium]
MQKSWEFKKNDDAKKSLIERLLAIRGITKKTDIKNFLNPLDMKLSEPTAFCDMEKSVERIVKSIETEQKILIYGDFDADGITSTSILIKTLKHLGANVDYYIPDRENEGHGMNTKTLVKIMTSKKPKLLITVDCGVSNVEEVKFLNSFGIDVIITDHHEAPEELPPAFAIINPKAPNALEEKLSAGKILELTALAGCGVALKLAQALLLYYEKPEFIYEILPLVAVGTIADLVPLIGENRYFVMKGLELISKGQHKGLTKLLESSGYNPENGITSENIAFGVAPRINATGRLDNVETSLKVLLSDNNAELDIAVQTLNELNKVRQNLCESTFLEAEEIYLKGNTNDNAIVLFNKNWNIGIIGIVASRFVEKYYKPAFIMTYHDESKQYRCSARSVKGIHLYNVLDANEEMFDGFGGHEMAAGFSFSEEKASFEQVKQALNETIKEMSEGLELKPFINIDLLLEEKDLDLTIVDEIAKLEPFGMSNPSPVFAVKDFVLKEKTLMGENKNHLRLKVQGKESLYTCVWWSHGDISLIAGDKLDIAFTPKLNNFRDNISLQLMIEDIHSEHLVEQESHKNTQTEVKIFDHRNKSDILQQVEDYVATSKLEIVVFAENKEIVDGLKHYKFLSERVISRQSLKPADSIMFFDYPPAEEIFNEIINNVSPRHIHYMACNFKNDEQNILKTISGMIKFTCNNKNGKFELEKAASFLGLTVECIETLLQIFETCKMISVKEKNENEYNLKFIKNIELSQVLHCTDYIYFKELLSDIASFREELMKKTLV